MKLTAESEVRIFRHELDNFRLGFGCVRLWWQSIDNVPALHTFSANRFDYLGDNGVILWQPEALSDEAD